MCLGTAVKKKTTFWEFRLQAAPRFVYMPVEQLKTIRGYAIFHNRFRRRLPLIRFSVAFEEFSAVFGEGLDWIFRNSQIRNSQNSLCTCTVWTTSPP